MKRYFRVLTFDGKELFYYTNDTGVVVVCIFTRLDKEIIECYTGGYAGELFSVAPPSDEITPEMFLAAYHKFENRCKEIINSTGL